ncbi:NADPH-dependent diflavin oxidoreductase 1-like [Oppia nitens]|uniref:NADPH-dependent diflavin oxidoreductase 1-like n=1 Tax=Oppia nitens TaxID=1686743 RepID=UPI0023D97E37|nr:NADPH-dependent diflavin oxidoreductase 1-like [Oppia nitens]
MITMVLTQEVYHLLILYGSETGNCEELAKSIGREAINRGIDCNVLECDDYDVSQLIDQKLVLFVCSTTGVGEEPNNMKNFWAFIRRRDLPNDSLSSVYVSVIGLGDSSYSKYNFVAKKLHKRLLCLGAKPLTDLVLGDDQHECGPNATIDPFLSIFWDKVFDFYSIINNFENLSLTQDLDQLFTSSFSVKYVNENDRQNEITNYKSSPFDKHNPYLAKVLSNERITAKDHFQDVRLIKLGINDKQLNYSLGDVCCIKPQNSKENVQKFISLLNLDENEYFVLDANPHNWINRKSYYNNLPKPCSVLTLVTEYLDIQSVPKRSFFQLFYRFSDFELEKQKLKEFAKSDSLDDLYEYCNRPKRSILEVLQDFPHTTARIKFEYIFDLIPAINPRYYSIASSLNVRPNELHLLVAVVSYKTRLKDLRYGLCSNWLAIQLPSEDSCVAIYIKKSNFKIVTDNKPIIMIGPGTGVAPFRAFIEDRVNRQVTDNYLFFGCRYKKSDFYFENEWKQYNEMGFLNFFVAFSRDTDTKVYVQHKLSQQKDLIFNLITDKSAVIYVAGNAKQMPQQVRQSICDIFKSHFNEQLDNDKIQQIVNNLELRGRLQYECWS